MPSYCVLGGCGFIGRQIVQDIIDDELTKKVRVVDKKMSGMANMSQAQEELFDNEKVVEFIQADLTREDHLQRAFAGKKFDYVINCAGETELGLDAKIYDTQVTDLAIKAATAANKMGAKFIHISDAHVYKSDAKPVKEDGKIDPSTKLAEAHLAAEEGLKKIPGLDYVVLRCSNVYGPGDRQALMPRCVLSALYLLQFKSTLKMPFNGKVIYSCVHVRDVARAALQACIKGKSGSVYNLADPANITFGEINTLLEQVFSGVKIDFVNGAMNMALKAAVKSAATMINDEHMKPWADLCKAQGIEGPILSPFLAPETLTDAPFCIDGSKISEIEFDYKHQKPNAGLILEEVNYWRKIGQFPK